MTSQETKYKATDKMAEIICENAQLLQVMNRFGISLGFGDENIMQVCNKQGVDYKTFLAVINFVSQKHTHLEERAEVSVAALLNYLKQSHIYFLDFALPNIRKSLNEAIFGKADNSRCSLTGTGSASDADNTTCENEPETAQLSSLIMKFYDDYVHEVRKHMEYEEAEVFPFVEALLEGKNEEKDKIYTFSEHHNPVDEKLHELKNIIIKYYPGSSNSENGSSENGTFGNRHAGSCCNNKMSAVLYDIFSCEQELKSHCKIEDYLFVPAVMNLKKQM